MSDKWQLKAVLSLADSLSPALRVVNANAKATRKYLSDVVSAANGLGGKLGLPLAAVSAIGTGLSIGAIKGAVTGFTDLGEAAQKGALKAGMSVEEWQRMKYVADQSSTGIEAMEGSLSKLNKTAGNAAAGQDKGAAGLFAHLGIKLRDANGQVRRGIDLLPELADAFQRNANPAVQARMGMELFGKSYAEILPLLSEGSAGIQANLDRFARVKGVLSKDDIAAAKDLGDSFKDLELVSKGFQGTVARELAPTIKDMVDGMVAWWVANKKVVGSEVTAIAKDLKQWVAGIDFKGLAADAQSLGGHLKGLVDMVGGTRNAMIALALYMNIQTLQAVWGLGAAIFRLGVGMVGLAWRSIPSVVTALTGYTASAGTASAATSTLNARVTTLLGTLGTVAAAAAPLVALWAAKEWAEDTSQDQERVESRRGIGDALNGMLGFLGFDKNAEIEQRLAANRAGLVTDAPSLAAAPQIRAGGEIKVSFVDAPPGTRVEQAGPRGDVPLTTDVGYRSFATGSPW